MLGWFRSFLHVIRGDFFHTGPKDKLIPPEVVAAAEYPRWYISNPKGSLGPTDSTKPFDTGLLRFGRKGASCAATWKRRHQGWAIIQDITESHALEIGWKPITADALMSKALEDGAMALVAWVEYGFGDRSVPMVEDEKPTVDTSPLKGWEQPECYPHYYLHEGRRDLVALCRYMWPRAGEGQMIIRGVGLWESLRIAEARVRRRGDYRLVSENETAEWLAENAPDLAGLRA